MRRNSWIVGNYGQCFYCGKNPGEEHDKECIIRRRTVVVELSIELVMCVPECWTPEDPGYCENNFLVLLDELEGRTDRLCNLMDIQYVREANEEDEKSQKLFIKEKFT